METNPIYVARDVQSTCRSSPRDRDERDRDAATTTTVYSHAHAHHHTMFTVRASAQKTTVAVDARAAKKADAKRYARPTARPRDIRIATRTDPDDGTDRSIDPNDATRARETRRLGVTVFSSVARRIRR